MPAAPRHPSPSTAARRTPWAFALAVAAVLPLPATAARLRLQAVSVEAAGWLAEGVALSLAPQGALEFRAQALRLRPAPQANASTAASDTASTTAPPPPLLRAFVLRCPALQVSAVRLSGEGCGLKAATSPLGALDLRWRLGVEHRRAAFLALEGNAGGAGLTASATLDAAALRAELRLPMLPLDGLLAAAPALAAALPKGSTLAGRAALVLAAQADGGTQRLEATLTARELTFGEPGGRYATDKLAATLRLDLRRALPWLTGAALGAPVDAATTLTLDGGQGYAEPVFLDFGEAAVRVEADARLLTGADGALRLDLGRLQLRQADSFAGGGSASLRLSPFAVTAAELAVDDVQLARFLPRFAAPFLTSTPAADAEAGGTASARLSVQGGRVQRAQLSLRDASLVAKRYDVALDGLDGTVTWTAAGRTPEPTRLVWKGARLGKLVLPGANLALRLAGDRVTLLEPLRQPVLDGALRIDQLQLDLRTPARAAGGGSEAGVATGGAQARLIAEIEPIDLARLTKALGWPEFSGRLAGRLPGLSYRDGVLALDGALTAEVFDGFVRIENLRWVEPAARTRRLTADVTLRRIDLAALTGAFSYGRIDGRVDGDVRGLQLVGFTPTAFDARFYTSPERPGRRRISQRAIDNISSLGGGPQGVLGRSVLRFFDDFGYEKLGISCVLRDGVCAMGGVEPARDGGYVLVKGSLLPRIDVVGHSRRVDWATFTAQLLGLRDLQAPETGVQVGR